MPLNPALKRQRQAELGQLGIQRDPVLKKQKKIIILILSTNNHIV